MERLTIGAVANLTGVPTHTLRKWESRHSIVTPNRSESGRRFYTNEHVQRLLLVKRLMGEGHSLAELARLNNDELDILAVRHEQSRAANHDGGADVVGLNLTTLFERAEPSLAPSFSGFSQTLEKWLDQPQHVKNSKHGTLVVESDTLPDAVVDQLVVLRSKHYQRIVVIYAFAPRRIEQLLASHGIQAIKAPASSEKIRSYLSVEAPKAYSSSYQVGVSAFDPEQLSHIANMMPSLNCECPNHIAKLLIDINGFEKYCMQCVDDDPSQSSLHGQLADMTAHARSIFEDALRAVALADGLDLASLPTQTKH
jgi:DNA-binding transcriptional MerR regulator